jgi:hypothetical protein
MNLSLVEENDVEDIGDSQLFVMKYLCGGTNWKQSVVTMGQRMNDC